MGDEMLRPFAAAFLRGDLSADNNEEARDSFFSGPCLAKSRLAGLFLDFLRMPVGGAALEGGGDLRIGAGTS